MIFYTYTHTQITLKYCCIIRCDKNWIENLNRPWFGNKYNNYKLYLFFFFFFTKLNDTTLQSTSASLYCTLEIFIMNTSKTLKKKKKAIKKLILVTANYWIPCYLLLLPPLHLFSRFFSICCYGNRSDAKHLFFLAKQPSLSCFSSGWLWHKMKRPLWFEEAGEGTMWKQWVPTCYVVYLHLLSVIRFSLCMANCG